MAYFVSLVFFEDGGDEVLFLCGEFVFEVGDDVVPNAKVVGLGGMGGHDFF